MDVDTIIYIIFAILFWIGPAIIKLLKGASKAPKSKPVAARPVEAQQQPPRSRQMANMKSKSASTVSARADRPVQSTPFVIKAKSDSDRLKQAQSLKSRSEVLVSTCEQFGEAGDELASLVQKSVLLRATALVESILTKDKSAGSKQIDTSIVQIEEQLSILEYVITQRVKSDIAAELCLLDLLLQDYRTPFVVHSQRLGLNVAGLSKFVTLKEAGHQRIGFGVDSSLAHAMEKWPKLSFEVAHNYWFGAGRLASATLKSLKLPNVFNSMSYFYSTGRITLTGLFAAWLPTLFADVCFACQVGPLAGGILLKMAAEDAAVGSHTHFNIDAKLNVDPLPLYLRMYVVSNVLSQVGFSKEAEELIQKWERKFGNPESIVMSSSRFPDMSLPTADFIEGLNLFSGKLLNDPLPILGSYPIRYLPGILMDEAKYIEIKEAAKSLALGDSISAEPSVIIGGVNLAVSVSAVNAERAFKSAGASLLGGGAEVASTSEGDLGSSSFDDVVLGSKKRIAQAIVVSSVVSNARAGVMARNRNELRGVF